MLPYFLDHKAKLDQVKKLFRQFDERDFSDLTAKKRPLSQAERLLTDLKFETSQVINGKGQLNPTTRAVFLLAERWEGFVQQRIKSMEGHVRLQVDLVNAPEDLIRRDEVVLTFRVSNTGTIPANEVRLELATGHGCQLVSEPVATVSYITGNKPMLSAFTFKPQQDRFDLTLTVTYSEDIGEQRQTFTHQRAVELFEETRPFRFIANPYRTGNMAQMMESSTDLFYGRQDTIQALRNVLVKSNDNLVILHGQRRTGKSCLLKYIRAKNSFAPLPVVLLDVQSVSTEADFYRRIVRDVARALSIEPPATDAITDFDGFEKALNDLLVSGEQVVLIMLDEFEHVYEIVNDGQNFTMRLRSLIQNYARLKFMLAGADALKRIIGDYKHPLFKAGRIQPISFLNPADSYDLITRPLADQVTFTQQAVDRIQDLTHHHPYFVQVICDRIVMLLNEKASTMTVTLTEVEQAYDKLNETFHDTFDYVWDITGTVSHVILAILAEKQTRDRRYIDIEAIEDELDTHGISYDGDITQGPIRELLDKDLILESPAELEYTISMGLLRDWIARYKKVKRVLREFK